MKRIMKEVQSFPEEFTQVERLGKKNVIVTEKTKNRYSVRLIKVREDR